MELVSFFTEQTAIVVEFQTCTLELVISNFGSITSYADCISCFPQPHQANFGLMTWSWPQPGRSDSRISGHEWIGWRIGGNTSDFMEQSLSWEDKSRSASKIFTRFSWNPKVHYRVHNSLPLVRILSQIPLVHNFPSHLHAMNSNIILPSTSRTSEWSLPFRCPDQNSI